MQEIVCRDICRHERQAGLLRQFAGKAGIVSGDCNHAVILPRSGRDWQLTCMHANKKPR
jgi:hypothetical protein